MISVQFETLAKESIYLCIVNAKMVPVRPQAKVTHICDTHQTQICTAKGDF